MSPVQDLADALFINEVIKVSAPNALTLTFGPVPAKKLWTIQAASYFPDAVETRTVQWLIMNPNGTTLFAVSLPISIALWGAACLPLVTEGLDFCLFPGQYLMVRRDVATVGSAMTMDVIYVESDMPLYHYVEPLEKSRIRKTTLAQFSRGPGQGGPTGAVIGPRGGFVSPRQK
jgi:hypothetical protein